ncbi:hypothetical protein FACS1894202_09770 [Clostridia bacterium]|nr:hypothetical protein FACS1894202_09770 [Clostridia bacterium]
MTEKLQVNIGANASGFMAGVKQMQSGMNSLKKGAAGLGAALAAAVSVTAIVAFGKASVKAATEASNAFAGLESIIKGQGRSFSKATSYIDSYVKDGLVPMQNAVTAYKNLAARGYDDTQIIDRVSEVLPFGTFELDGWKLDGSMVIPPTPEELPDAQIGWLSEQLSDADGYFSTQPQITVVSPYTFDPIALTLYWGMFPASDFTADWYNGDALVSSKTITDNTDNTSIVAQAVSGVNRVVVTVTRTATPRHRARLAEFVPGAVITYNRANGRGLQITESTDALSERAVTRTLSLTAANIAREFNIFDPTSIYIYFRERMRINTQIWGQAPGADRQLIDMGAFYISRPELKGNLSEIALSATGLLGTLADTVYSKGIYREGTIASFVDDIAEDAGVAAAYPDSFNALVVDAYIGTMSHAQAFKLIAQATGTILTDTRGDYIAFLAPSGNSELTIGQIDYSRNNGFAPSDDTIVNTVTVEHITLVPGAEEELTKFQISGEPQNAAFHADNAVITTDSGEFSVSYDASAEQRLDGGVIYGKKLKQTKGSVTASAKQPYEPSFVYKVGGNVFITPANAPQLADYYLGRRAVKRRTVKVNYRGYPYLQTGDIVDFASEAGSTQPFFITKNTLSLGGGMGGELEAREL